MEEQIDFLQDDVEQNRAYLHENKSQLARRNFLRSLYAFYEINLSKLRETAIKLLLDEHFIDGNYDLHKIYPLMDDVARIKENGKIYLEPNHTSFKSMIAYTLKTYAASIDLQGDILSDHRWASFCTTIRIRHRITHPKFHEEVDITDEELEIIIEGLDWWNNTMKRLGEAHLQMITKTNE